MALYLKKLPVRTELQGTMIALYAGGTKIWREINSYKNQFVLQSDINSLYPWSFKNKMTFHPSKCKVLSVGNNATKYII